MKLKNRTLFASISLLGMTAVIIGAFGAHGLEDKISSSSLSSYKTGVAYHFYHSLAGCFVLILFQLFENKFFKWAAICFIIGTLFFSGSIYLLTTNSITNIGMTQMLGPLTPIGGLFFIFGWVFTFLGLINS